jgi:hypothetical protein
MDLHLLAMVAALDGVEPTPILKKNKRDEQSFYVNIIY